MVNVASLFSVSTRTDYASRSEVDSVLCVPAHIMRVVQRSIVWCVYCVYRRTLCE